MTDPRIQTFLTLYDRMNYHEAAALLNITQPAVTQHIKALQSDYGCVFFRYDGRRLARTKEAELFESYARTAVFNERKLRELLGKPSVRSFRIGATKSIGKYMIAEMTAEFLKDSSRTAEITVDNTEKLLGMLDSDLLDFALIEGPFNKVRYGSKLFRRENMTGICAGNHRLAGRSVNIEELFTETFIMREKGSGTAEIFSEVLTGMGYTTDAFARVVIVNDFSLLCGLVSMNTGVSFVYSSVAQKERGLGCFSIKGAETRHDLNIVFLKNTVASDLADEYMSCLQSARSCDAQSQVNKKTRPRCILCTGVCYVRAT